MSHKGLGEYRTSLQRSKKAASAAFLHDLLSLYASVQTAYQTLV